MAKDKKQIQKEIDEWQRRNLRRYTIKVNKEKYPEIIDRLEEAENIQKYIIDLLLKDING